MFYKQLSKVFLSLNHFTLPLAVLLCSSCPIFFLAFCVVSFLIFRCSYSCVEKCHHCFISDCLYNFPEIHYGTFYFLYLLAIYKKGFVGDVFIKAFIWFVSDMGCSFYLCSNLQFIYIVHFIMFK